MSLTVNFCPNMSIRKLFCNWCQDEKDGDDDKLYKDTANSIAIMPTSSEIKVDEYVIFDDIKSVDFATVVSDPQGVLRYADIQGVYAFRHDKLTEEKLRGQVLNEVLPVYICHFLIPLYQQTLSGAFCTIPLMWKGEMLLLRTYPIIDHTKRVLAAKSIISPFNPAYNSDVDKFIVKMTANRVVARIDPSFVQRSESPKRECFCL